MAGFPLPMRRFRRKMPKRSCWSNGISVFRYLVDSCPPFDTPTGCGRGLHQLLEGARAYPDRLLCQAVKQLAAVAGPTPIEPEGELVEVVVQMRCADAALMGS